MERCRACHLLIAPLRQKLRLDSVRSGMGNGFSWGPRRLIHPRMVAWLTPIMLAAREVLIRSPLRLRSTCSAASTSRSAKVPASWALSWTLRTGARLPGAAPRGTVSSRTTAVQGHRVAAACWPNAARNFAPWGSPGSPRLTRLRCNLQHQPSTGTRALSQLRYYFVTLHRGTIARSYGNSGTGSRVPSVAATHLASRA